jgi:hypothetical protein
MVTGKGLCTPLVVFSLYSAFAVRTDRLTTKSSLITMCVKKRKAVSVRLRNVATLTFADLVSTDFLLASAALRLFRHIMTPLGSGIAPYLVIIVHLNHFLFSKNCGVTSAVHSSNWFACIQRVRTPDHFLLTRGCPTPSSAKAGAYHPLRDLIEKA